MSRATADPDPCYYDPALDALDEGKAIGTANNAHLVLTHNLAFQQDYRPTAFAEARRKGAAAGRRTLGAAQARVRADLADAVARYAAGRLPEDRFRAAAVRTMKTAWRDVFLAGVRAGGTAASAKLHPGDDRWLRGAVAHEMRFLNGMLDAVVEGTGTMPIDRRIGMYADSLASFFESARIIALPYNVVVHWLAEDRPCPGCEFLAANSPYTKHGLPTVPKAGSCQCLSACLCRLYVRRVTDAELAEVADAQRYTRDGMIRKLRDLKAGRFAQNP